MAKIVRFELSKLIKEKAGMSFQDYCRNVLCINEKSFYYDLRKGKITIKHSLKIIELTGMTYEYLFKDFEQPTKYNVKYNSKAEQEPAGDVDQEEVVNDSSFFEDF